jgi:oligosaccharyltransferase complex subunit gamma
VVKPVDYVTPFLGLVSVLSVAALVKVLWSRFVPILQNSRVWSSLSLMFIVHMTSGAMWNRIRGAPYSGKTDDGRPELFAGGQQSQYQIETQIISLIYAVLALCLIVMIKHIPKIANANTQRVAVYAAMGVFLGVYSWLISIFRNKSGGYPYKIIL